MSERNLEYYVSKFEREMNNKYINISDLIYELEELKEKGEFFVDIKSLLQLISREGFKNPL